MSKEELADHLNPLLARVRERLKPYDQDFVGRETVRQKVEAHTTSVNRFLLLVAPYEVGKTALALDLVTNPPHGAPCLAHFCDLPTHDNPLEFCKQMATQLVALFGDRYKLDDPSTGQQLNVAVDQDVEVAQPGSQITGVDLKVYFGPLNPRDAFMRTVVDPLKKIDAANETLVIVVDALDRAAAYDSNPGSTIVDVLQLAQELPPWVCLICTSRPGPAVTALRNHGVPIYHLEPLGKENLDDIKLFLRERLLAGLGERRERFQMLLVEHFRKLKQQPSMEAAEAEAAFVDRVAEASEGSFLNVRRYVAAWKAALKDGGSYGVLKPDVLLGSDTPDKPFILSLILANCYENIYTEVLPNPDAEPQKRKVMIALANAFAPIDKELLEKISGETRNTIDQVLHALTPVLEKSAPPAVAEATPPAPGAAPAADKQPCYRFSYRGFASYVRQENEDAARKLDLDAARVLEQLDIDDEAARAYSRDYRDRHLLRGLGLTTSIRLSDSASTEYSQTPTSHTPTSIPKIEEQVTNLAQQAQVLRLLATNALRPSEIDRPGSWQLALDALQTAERNLRRSRSVLDTRRSKYRYSGRTDETLEQYERTLIALGNAYATLVQRMGVDEREVHRSPGWTRVFQAAWDFLALLPVKLYLSFILFTARVRGVSVQGAWKNIGSNQDWTVARLCGLSLYAYSRARKYASEHEDDKAVDEIDERLARLYTSMGAYKAAKLVYESLLSRPAAMQSLWQQAVWRLALGEVLVAEQTTDRAIEVLKSVVPTFLSREAPIPRARTLSALAMAYYQRSVDARRRGTATPALDRELIDTCDGALTAWARVTELPDENADHIDQSLAVSRVGHLLWLISRDRRFGSDLNRRARLFMDTLDERHFLQRFEHPLLQLFRAIAAAILPLVVLLGLMLAVQLPNSVQVRQKARLPDRAPLIDLGAFPNPIIDSLGAPVSATGDQLIDVVDSAGTQIDVQDELQLRTEVRALDQVALTWRILGFMLFYLAGYTLLGILIIRISRPAGLQRERPGRWILGRESVSWRGPPPRTALQISLVQMSDRANHWFKPLVRRYRGVAQSAYVQGIAAWFSARRGPRGAATPGGDAQEPQLELAFADVEHIVIVERRIFGHVLGDFSSRRLLRRMCRQQAVGAQQLAGSWPALLIKGSVVNYAELCSELDRQLKDRPTEVRRDQFILDPVRSVWGFLFTLALGLAVLLLLLIGTQLSQLSVPIAMLGGYSLSQLYVLITPGLLLPLVWWIVAQPLGARRVSRTADRLLTGTIIAAVLLTATVWTEYGTLHDLGLKPDLAIPVLALGCLLALIVYGRPYLQNGPASLRVRAFSWVTTVFAVVGLGLVLYQMWRTVQWHHALVRGNQAAERALVIGDCAGTGTCGAQKAALGQAVELYSRMIMLRPDDSDGHTLRGFAHLKLGDYEQAKVDFEAALRRRQSRVQTQLMSTLLPSSSAAQITKEDRSLRANLGAVHALIARDYAASAAAGPRQIALNHFNHSFRPRAAAQTTGFTFPRVDLLGWLGANPARAAARSQPALVAGTKLSCDMLVRKLLSAAPPDSMPPKLDLLAAPTYQPAADELGALLQLGDACYNSGLARFQAHQQEHTGASGPVPLDAWNDVASAVHAYRAVATFAHGPDRELAAHNLGVAWLTLSLIQPSPQAEPERRAIAQQMHDVYERLAQRSAARPWPLHWLPTAPLTPGAAQTANAGLIWSALQLGAWDLAREPLEQAGTQAGSDPLYAALYGMVAWLDSTRYTVATKLRPEPNWTAAVNEAIGAFDQAINNGGDYPDQLYATRSVLHAGLRNSPRGAAYDDTDYRVAMRHALADADNAVLYAERALGGANRAVVDAEHTLRMFHGESALDAHHAHDVVKAERTLAERRAELARLQQAVPAYRYWRARVSVSLALTLQERWRGPFSWAEVEALYSRALDDFDAAIAGDPVSERSKQYREYWRPWVRVFQHNAAQIRRARLALELRQFEAAERELSQVKLQPFQIQPAVEQRWPYTVSFPKLDYSMLRALALLGRSSEPPDDDGVSHEKRYIEQARSAFEQAYARSTRYLENVSPTDSRDARRTFYSSALADVRAVLAVPDTSLTPAAREVARSWEQRLVKLEAAVQP